MTLLAAAPDGVDLYWVPLGAGAHVARWCGLLYEAIAAARQGRRRADLYHAALEVRVAGRRHVIEMAPVWDRAEPERGVVAEGPVGLRWLGRFRWFRYEVRCWVEGLIPDVRHAVGGPRALSCDRAHAERVLAALPAFPEGLVWGRDEQHTGDMWNSNSLVSWLLLVSGHDMDAIRPPAHGRAPGWHAGMAAARAAASQLGRQRCEPDGARGAEKSVVPRGEDQ